MNWSFIKFFLVVLTSYFYSYQLGYPAQDLPMKSVNHIVYKIRPSVIEKLKVSHLMRFLLQYFVLVESEKIELAGQMMSLLTNNQGSIFL